MMINREESFWLKCGVRSIDHYAVTTDDLYRVLHDYLGIPGCELLRGPGTNTCQNVDYAFVKTAQGMVVEILGVKEGSPISEHVKKGGGAYHLCFLVDDLDRAAQTAVANGAMKVVEQRPDDAFDQRRVAFFIHPAHGLFEFLEACPSVNEQTQSTPVKADVRQEKLQEQVLTSGLKSELEIASDKLQGQVFSAFKTIFPQIKSINDALVLQLGTTPDWDSLAQLRLVMAVEQHTGKKFTVDELTQLTSFQAFLNRLSE
jgi:acyl carrier protein